MANSSILTNTKSHTIDFCRLTSSIISLHRQAPNQKIDRKPERAGRVPEKLRTKRALDSRIRERAGALPHQPLLVVTEDMSQFGRPHRDSTLAAGDQTREARRWHMRYDKSSEIDLIDYLVFQIFSLPKISNEFRHAEPFYWHLQSLFYVLFDQTGPPECKKCSVDALLHYVPTNVLPKPWFARHAIHIPSWREENRKIWRSRGC